MFESYKTISIFIVLVAFAVIFGTIFASAVRYRLSKENELTPLSDPLWVELLWMVIPCIIVFSVMFYTYIFTIKQERLNELINYLQIEQILPGTPDNPQSSSQQ